MRWMRRWRGVCVQEKQPLQVRINVDGNPHVMHISYGADVHAGVAEFAAKLGLTDESKQALTKQVTEPLIDLRRSQRSGASVCALQGGGTRCWTRSTP
jgi:hypothetical protein